MLSKQSLFLRYEKKRKQDSLFLKGPITFEWINENIPDPSSRIILIARAFMEMQNIDEVSLSRKIWDSAGISGKDTRHRVLQKINAHAKGYVVVPRIGRTALLRKQPSETRG